MLGECGAGKSICCHTCGIYKYCGKHDMALGEACRCDRETAEGCKDRKEIEQ